MTYIYRESRFPDIPMSDLAVPIDRCLTVTEGPVSLRVIEEMRRIDFSQAVVLASGTPRQYGVVSLERLEALHRDRLPLGIDDDQVSRSMVRCEAAHSGWHRHLRTLEGLTGNALTGRRRLDLIRPLAYLDHLLEELSVRSAALVACHDEAWVENEHVVMDEPEVIGLITVADLNKHALRAAIYPLLARLEASLALLVDRYYGDDPWAWIMRLESEDSRARVVGYWKLSERDGVNVGATAGAMLSELLRAASAEDKLRQDLGFTQRAAFVQATKHLHRFRNLIMHPVRPLIRSPEDCLHLKNALAAAIDLNDKARARLSP